MTLTMTGSPMQLPFGKPEKSITFTTPASNSGIIYLSTNPSDVQGNSLRYPLPVDSNRTLQVVQLGDIWTTGTAGDTLSIFGEIEKSW
jgi:hypothetical protein